MFALSFWEICVKKNHREQMTGWLPLQPRWQNAVLSSGCVNFSRDSIHLFSNQNKAPEYREKTEGDEKSKKQMDELSYFFFPKVCLMDCPSDSVFEALLSRYQSETEERSLSCCANPAVSRTPQFEFFRNSEQALRHTAHNTHIISITVPVWTVHHPSIHSLPGVREPGLSRGTITHVTHYL